MQENNKDKQKTAIQLKGKQTKIELNGRIKANEINEAKRNEKKRNITKRKKRTK